MYTRCPEVTDLRHSNPARASSRLSVGFPVSRGNAGQLPSQCFFIVLPRARYTTRRRLLFLGHRSRSSRNLPENSAILNADEEIGQSFIYRHDDPTDDDARQMWRERRGRKKKGERKKEEEEEEEEERSKVSNSSRGIRDAPGRSGGGAFRNTPFAVPVFPSSSGSHSRALLYQRESREGGDPKMPCIFVTFVSGGSTHTVGEIESPASLFLCVTRANGELETRDRRTRRTRFAGG